MKYVIIDIDCDCVRESLVGDYDDILKAYKAALEQVGYYLVEDINSEEL
jgi:hypothetical protein